MLNETSVTLTYLKDVVVAIDSCWDNNNEVSSSLNDVVNSSVIRDQHIYTWLAYYAKFRFC